MLKQRSLNNDPTEKGKSDRIICVNRCGSSRLWFKTLIKSTDGSGRGGLKESSLIERICNRSDVCRILPTCKVNPSLIDRGGDGVVKHSDEANPTNVTSKKSTTTFPETAARM